MKKKIISFFGTLAMVFVSQSAWAAAGDKTICDTKWSLTEFDNGTYGSIHDNIFEGKGNYTTFTISGSKNAHYETATGPFGAHVSTLAFSPTKDNTTDTWKITWTETGATVAVTRVKTHVHVYHGYAPYCKYFLFSLNGGKTDAIGTITPNYMDNGTASWTSFSTDIDPTQKEIPFSLYIQKPTIGNINNSEMLFMRDLEIWYNVIPDAPTWTKAADNMNVTVDDVMGQKFYNLSSNINVTNPAFAGTVKYEITSNNAQYAVWNGEHNAFYVLKPGTYTVKAYIEKVDGQYCSSAYSTEFAVTATTADADKDNAQVYFYFDEQKVEAFDRSTHVYKVELPLSSAIEHWVEYVSATPDNVVIENKTERGLKYLEKTEYLKDHFTLLHKSESDTIMIEQNGVYYRLVIVSTTMGTNHLPYTIDAVEKFNNTTIVTYTNNVSFDDEHNDIEFAKVGAFETEKTRTVEFAYTGIPDSIKFSYNTLAERNRNNVRLKISYATTPGNWIELAQVTAPQSTTTDKNCAYALPANAKYVQVQYYNAEYQGWVRNFTITEKKAITFPQDTLVITGTHTPDGVATKTTTVSWYNVLGPLSWGKGTKDADKFEVKSSPIPAQLDNYKENIPYDVEYKLDEPGIHYTNIMCWSQDNPAVIAYYTVKGITAYGEKEIIVDNNLPEDTVAATPGEVIPSPFVVKDTAGNELPAEYKDSIKYDYTITPAESATIDENGNITPNCVGVIRIIAELQPNSLVPAAKDTVYLNVPEASKNVIKWNLPLEIAKGDTLPEDLASTEDGAEMTYEFIPATAVQVVTGGYEVLQVGTFQIVAKAAQTCAHFAINDTADVYAKGLVASIELNNTVDPTNLNVLDTIANMFVVKGESGDTLDAPEVNITYTIEPANMHQDEDGNFIVDHSGDVKVTVTVIGDTLKTASQEFNFTLNPIQEQIFCNLPETLLIENTYDLKNVYTSTLSQLGIASVRVPETYESMLEINGCTITTKKKGVVRIIMTAEGNDDFIGPVEYMMEITIVSAVKDINWEDELAEDIENAQVGDTIHTSDVKVYDENGHEITDAEKTYQIIPEGAAHVTPEGDVVIDQPVNPITIVVVTEKEGMETKVDTINFTTKPASVSEVELPAAVVLGEIHKGDVVPMDGIKVYDQNGKDITDQIDEITYIIEPSDAAHIDENGDLVIDKAEPFTITTVVTDPLIDPEHSSYTTPVTVAPFEVEQIVQPVISGNVLPGDEVSMVGTKVYDNEGNDITDKCNITYVFEPEGSAQYDEQTGIITFLNSGAVKVVTVVTGKEGEGVQGKNFEEVISVGKLTPAPEYNLPEPPEGFHGGDVIPVDLVDVNGNPINDFTDVDVKINPEDKATYNPETGEITIKEGVEGPVDVTITVGGDNVQPAITYTETIYVHNDETGCYSLMTQLWDDAAMVDNDKEYSPVEFVSYEWYKDGVKVEGQNGQFYYEAKGAAMKGVYRAVAYDASGNAYKICEQEFDGTTNEIVRSGIIVYPTLLSTGESYTIEPAMDGQVVVTTTNGSVMDRFHVMSGVNTKAAPAASGVFVLHYTSADGHSQACKLIVK